MVTLWPVTFSDLYPTTFYGDFGASGLAVDRQGNTWVGFTQDTDGGSDGRLVRIAPSGKLTEYTLPTGHPKPNPGSPPFTEPFTIQGMTTGPDGNVWFTESAGDFGLPMRIVRVTPSGGFIRFPVAKVGTQGQPDEIIPGPGGKLYFSVRDVNSDVPNAQQELGVVTTGGRVSIINLPNDKKDPTGSPGVSADGPLTVGPDGEVYFVNHHFGYGGGEIDRLNLKPRAKG